MRAQTPTRQSGHYPRSNYMPRRAFSAGALILAALLVFSPGKAQAQCADPVGVAGEQIYNKSHDVMQYCNGSDWIGLYIVGATKTCAVPLQEELASLPTSTGSVWGDGTYIYAGQSDGLRAYTFDGSSFSEVGFLSKAGGISEITGDANYIYAFSIWDQTLIALSFNGTTFTEITEVSTTTSLYDSWSDGTYIYLANYSMGTRAYSFDGTSFTLEGSFGGSQYTIDVWGDGTYIYSYDSTDEWRKLSFDGSTFTNLGSFTMPVYAVKTIYDGQYVYTATNAEGVRAFTFDGTTLTQEAIFDTPGTASGVWSDGTYVYVADSTSLRVYNGPACSYDGLGGTPTYELTGFSNTGETMPANISGGAIAVIDEYVYLFGGQIGTSWATLSANIYRAPTSDPTNWSDTGSDLPAALANSSLVIVDDYMYLYGGALNTGMPTANIYRASISDPTNWSDTGADLPWASNYYATVVANDYIYLFGGWDSEAHNTILRASVNTPTSVTFVGNAPVMGDTSIAVIGDNIYLYGGRNSSLGNSTNGIYTAPLTDPLSWSDTGYDLPANAADIPILIIGEHVYTVIMGNIYRAPLNDPSNFSDTGIDFSGALNSRQIAVIADKIYIYGGYNANAIYIATTDIVSSSEAIPDISLNPSWKYLVDVVADGENEEQQLPVADNLGNHIAEQTLQMEDFQIINIDKLNFGGLAGDRPEAWGGP